MNPGIGVQPRRYRRLSVVINGERKTVAEWRRVYGIGSSLYSHRRERKWSIVKAITTPPLSPSTPPIGAQDAIPARRCKCGALTIAPAGPCYPCRGLPAPRSINHAPEKP